MSVMSKSSVLIITFGLDVPMIAVPVEATVTFWMPSSNAMLALVVLSSGVATLRETKTPARRLDLRAKHHEKLDLLGSVNEEIGERRVKSAIKQQHPRRCDTRIRLGMIEPDVMLVGARR